MGEGGTGTYQRAKVGYNKVSPESALLPATSDLEFFSQIDESSIPEFCRIAIDFIGKGSNPRLCGVAAQKLGVSTETVVRAVEALAHLFIQGTRSDLTKQQFGQALLGVGVPASQAKVYAACFQANAGVIREQLTGIKGGTPSLTDVQWRLDMVVQSRAYRSDDFYDPRYVLELTTESESRGNEKHVIQSDYHTLNHVLRELQGAMDELNSKHCGRFLKYLK